MALVSKFPTLKEAAQQKPPADTAQNQKFERHQKQTVVGVIFSSQSMARETGTTRRPLQEQRRRKAPFPSCHHPTETGTCRELQQGQQSLPNLFAPSCLPLPHTPSVARRTLPCHIPLSPSTVGSYSNKPVHIWPTSHLLISCQFCRTSVKSCLQGQMSLYTFY